MSDCATCGACLDCGEFANLPYNIQGEPVFPWTIACPEGAGGGGDNSPVIVDPFATPLCGQETHGGSAPPPPAPVNSPGAGCNNNIISLICCDGSVQTVTIPDNASEAVRAKLINELVAICTRKLPFCAKDCPDPPCPPPPCPNPPCNIIYLFFSRMACCTVFCKDTFKLVEGKLVETTSEPFNYCIPAGRFVASTQKAADAAALALACAEARAHKICLSDLDPLLCRDAPYSVLVIAKGKFLAAPGYANFWSVDGDLPPGLAAHDGALVSGDNLVIDGTPTLEGVYTFTVSITAPDGDYMTKSYTLSVVGIGPDSLPDAVLGQHYSQPLVVEPDHSSEKWELVSGMPPGLSLSEDGFISGTPTGPTNTYQTKVKVTVEIP